MSTLEYPIITPAKAHVKQTTSACCGGTPASNADACCKLDEEKKNEGLAGCGCNSSSDKAKGSACC